MMKNALPMNTLTKKQKQFFNNGQTRKVAYRKEQLRKLKTILKENEQDIFDALQSDFSKPTFEAFGTELFVIYQEIDHLISNLDKWAKPKKVTRSLINFPSKSYIQPQPLGVSFIISPWNYPIQLTLNPALGSIAAGNCTILKPSEISTHTTDLLVRIINDNFDPGFLHVVQGGPDITQSVLDQPLDYIFYTGSARVGKIIMQRAAEQLTPITLELGGKSPAIVDQTADLTLAARRIAWGKFINAGQTCVSPDYVYVHHSIKGEFIQLISQEIQSFYGDNPRKSPDYARIINQEHTERLQGLLDPQKIITGGESDLENRYIAPTVMDDVTWEDDIMQDEIFGPILPILTYDNLEEIISVLNQKLSPLALYIFSTNKSNQQKITNNVTFGGGCINDTAMHLGNPELPFGGIGESGFGSYHGKKSFDTFSHQKSIMKKSNWFDNPLRYPPYEGKLKWFKKLAKYL